MHTHTRAGTDVCTHSCMCRSTCARASMLTGMYVCTHSCTCGQVHTHAHICTRAAVHTAHRGSVWLMLRVSSFQADGTSDLRGPPGRGGLRGGGRGAVPGACSLQVPLTSLARQSHLGALVCPARCDASGGVPAHAGPRAWRAEGSSGPHERCSLQTLCLKSQSHPERYKAASRALKAISKVRASRGEEGPRRPSPGLDSNPPTPTSGGDPEGSPAFHGGSGA